MGFVEEPFPPSNEYKHWEREQRKFDKRMAREAPRAENAAAEEAAKKSEAELQAKRKAKFEAERKAQGIE
jgi:hypothetical protein